VRRVFEQDSYADRALVAEAQGLAPRDRALAMQLAYGTVQRRATLDHVAARLSSRPPEKLDPPVLAAVRLGLFQLLYLDGIASHAAVNESVELCKRSARGGSGLVNAVLRRATREGRAIVDALDDSDAAGAALKHSVPEWLASMWFEELGADDARALLARVNEPAESALRVNTLKATDPLELPVASRPAPELPEGLILEEPFDVHGSALFGEGLVMPQSRASMAVARVLGPGRGERVLDLCAAPGAKTTHIAALMGGSGSVVAVERNPRRAEALRRTCTVMGAANVEVLVQDARQPPRPGDVFDRVLVDPPCSGLGTLQSRPDIRWRASPESVREMAALQSSILAVGADATASGGVLVYSVCTISRAEGEGLLDAFAASRPEFAVEQKLQMMPHREGSDGFFIARLRRAGGGRDRAEPRSETRPHYAT
jgi:16S rRNA (cytosine967-C5)-methyltransferase